MSVDPEVLLTILGMGLATYVTRAGGFFLMRFMPLGHWLEAWLKEIPGAIIIAIVAPATLSGGPPFFLGVAVTFAALRLIGHELLAVVCGIAAVAAMRPWL
ncbi:MAG: AzlD domain-containing protein [Proteobacteria bacterium]|nr:AzlD domain-containing protein [Pseudomonadota bacterium]MBI3497504.1 AzlD domain-containing protein [Pseudomonadota bacterium]